MWSSHLAALYAQAMADLRERYDPEVGLVRSGPMGGVAERTYRPAASLPYARALLREGDPASVKVAADIIRAVLRSQERDSGHPHCGNFLWLAGDAEVGDLNAVQFVLRFLLPILVEHGQLLPESLQADCQEAAGLALAEEERLDVAPTYTNIHLMSLFGLLIGGEWLGNDHYQQLGRRRWDAFVRLTVESGAPHEYNSSNYGAVDLATLAELESLVDDSAVRLQARLLYERIWLHLGLHFHLPTGQLAGPHCRAYWLPMTTGQHYLNYLLWRQSGWDWLLGIDPEGGAIPIESTHALELLLTDYREPAYLLPWLESAGEAMAYEVRETANARAGDDLTTYLTPSYALGTASQTYSIGTDCFYIEHQANYMMLHYARPGQDPGWGMAYSRYVVNDRHWGTLGAAPDRPKTANFYDQGHFAGVQLRNKAIGLYALMPQNEEIFSLKTVVAFPAGEGLEMVWVNGDPVHQGELPRAVEAGDWLIVEDGAVYVAVRALEPTRLGPKAPIVLERGPLGELWLCIYNYRGAPKRFWDYASLGGAFWRGNIKAGFVLEVAERGEYASASHLLDHLRQATIEDAVSDPHLRTVSYENREDRLSLSYDLWHTRPAGRRIDGTPYEAPALQSPLAVQGAGGALRAGQAALFCHPQPAWLIAQELVPEKRAWIAVNPEDSPTALRLETPCGVLAAREWGLGRIEWRAPVGGDQEIIIEGLAEPRGLSVPEGVSVTWHPSSSPPGKAQS